MDGYIEEFITYLERKKQKSPNTIQSYSRDLRQLREYCAEQGMVRIQDVTSVFLNSYILSLENLGKKPATISRVISSSRRFFQYLMDRRYIDSNPAEELKAPRVRQVQKCCPEKCEIERFFQQMTGTSPRELRDMAMLILMYETGIHVSELLELKLEDLNMQMDFVVCHERFGDQVLAFGRKTKQVLSDYLLKSRPYYVVDEECNLLFTNCNGQRMSRQGFWKMIRERGKQTGMEEILNVNALRQVRHLRT